MIRPDSNRRPVAMARGDTESTELRNELSNPLVFAAELCIEFFFSYYGDGGGDDDGDTLQGHGLTDKRQLTAFRTDIFLYPFW